MYANVISTALRPLATPDILGFNIFKFILNMAHQKQEKY